jgi:hypothetical protein
VTSQNEDQRRPKTRKEMIVMRKKNTTQSLRIIAVVTLMVAAGLSAFLALPLTAIGDPPPGPPVIDAAAIQLQNTTIGGAQVLPTTRTVPHWFGSTLDPNNAVTYGYNMVGADPNNCSGSGCDVTVTFDIIPLNVVVEGESFNGSDVVAATLASPVFALNDYGSTSFATAPGNFPDFPALIRGPGGVLSQNDAGNQLQLEDATMRAQFNKTGSSSYHLRLNPVVHNAITIVVPSGLGTVLQWNSGVHFGDVNIQWWAAQIQNFNVTLGYIDPTHLPLYLTKDLWLHCGQSPFSICSAGFHGAGEVNGNGPPHGNGNQPVQTFAWASYLTPGAPGGADSGHIWALQDIHGVSHEIAEWAHNPFITNTVEPWVNPRFPEFGCVSNLLETGDPVESIGFTMGTNTYFQGPNPNGTQSADGYYHPEDEVFVPWFMRVAPNNISEPTQNPSTNVGRYTLMGDLNPFPGYHQPATGCN